MELTMDLIDKFEENMLEYAEHADDKWERLHKRDEAIWATIYLVRLLRQEDKKKEIEKELGHNEYIDHIRTEVGHD